MSDGGITSVPEPRPSRTGHYGPSITVETDLRVVLHKKEKKERNPNIEPVQYECRDAPK